MLATCWQILAKFLPIKGIASMLMSMFKQVCGFESAVALSSANIKQHALLHWTSSRQLIGYDESFSHLITYPAYSVTQISEVLPKSIDGFTLRLDMAGGMWVAFYTDGVKRIYHSVAPTLADALAGTLNMINKNGVLLQWKAA